MKEGRHSKTVTKDVAIFEHNDLVGFEEIMRDYLRSKLKTEEAILLEKQEGKEEKPLEKPKREFTLVSNSV
jgi:hypothetical protein